MASVRVVIQDHTHSKKTTVELPDEVPMNRLLPALAERMRLPLQQGGNPIVYRLDHRRSGRRLDDDETLRAAGVESDDLLTLLPEVTAGNGSEVAREPTWIEVRETRLLCDHRRMLALTRGNELIHIEATEGDPPETYTLLFACRGVVAVEPAGPVFGEVHRVRLSLPVEYPTRPPQMRWLTPIFHPNINPEGTAVCVHTWYPSKFLDDLCVMLGRMIQYKNYNPEHGLRRDAALWSGANRQLLPVDRRPLRPSDPHPVEAGEFEIRFL